MFSQITNSMTSNDEISYVVGKWKSQFKSVGKINLSLMRTRDKMTRKHIHECLGDAEAAIENTGAFDYETLYEETSYLYYRILQPLQKFYTNVGDKTRIEAEVQEDGSLETSVHTELVISIPNNQEWVSYVATKYKNITKFAPHIQSMHYEISNHKVRKLTISMLFNVDFNMVRYMREQENNEQFFNNWISACHVIENYTKNHSSNIYVDIVDNKMKIHYRTMKVKFSKGIEL